MHLDKLPPRYRPRIAQQSTNYRPPSLPMICLGVAPFSLFAAYLAFKLLTT